MTIPPNCTWVGGKSPDHPMTECKIKEAVALEAALNAKLLAAVGGVGARTTVSLYHDHWELICRAARAHLSTLPRVKEVSVWYCQFVEVDVPDVAVCRTEGEAASLAATFERVGRKCVRVTGPHKQQVPA